MMRSLWLLCLCWLLPFADANTRFKSKDNLDTQAASILLSFSGVVFVITVASCVKFIQRSDIQPIKSRNASLVVLNVMMLAILQMNEVNQEVFQSYIPCWVGLLLDFTLVPFTGGLILARVFHLLFRGRMAIERMNSPPVIILGESVQQGKNKGPTLVLESNADLVSMRSFSVATDSTLYLDEETDSRVSLDFQQKTALKQARKLTNASIVDGEANSLLVLRADGMWFYSHRYMISRRVFLFFIGLILSTHLIVASVLIGTDDLFVRETISNCDEGSRFHYYAILLVLFFILLLIMAFQLKDLDDAFHIKKELRALGVMGMFFVLLYILQSYVFFRAGTFPYHVLTLVAGCLVTGALSTLYPLWLSYDSLNAQSRDQHDYTNAAELDAIGHHPDRIGVDSIAHQDIKLKDFFKDPLALQSFSAFLTAEWSVENIKFYLDVQEFKLHMSAMAKQAMISSHTGPLLCPTVSSYTSPLKVEPLELTDISFEDAAENSTRRSSKSLTIRAMVTRMSSVFMGKGSKPNSYGNSNGMHELIAMDAQQSDSPSGHSKVPSTASNSSIATTTSTANTTSTAASAALASYSAMGKAMCHVLVEDYLQHDAPLQINLPSHIVANLQRDLATIHLKLRTNTSKKASSASDDPARVVAPMDEWFDPAVNEILHLMQNDSFPRYLRSSFYREFMLKQTRAHTILAIRSEMQIV